MGKTVVPISGDSQIIVLKLGTYIAIHQSKNPKQAHRSKNTLCISSCNFFNLIQYQISNYRLSDQCATKDSTHSQKVQPGFQIGRRESGHLGIVLLLPQQKHRKESIEFIWKVARYKIGFELQHKYTLTGKQKLLPQVLCSNYSDHATILGHRKGTQRSLAGQ